MNKSAVINICFSIWCKFNIDNSVFCADPHVRVIGRMENVKLARDKIMQLLDTKVR